MVYRSGSLPYRKDSNNRLVRAGISVRDITNTTIKDSIWTAISMPAVINCKAILITTRDNSVWKISHLSDGARYSTIRGALTIDIAGGPAEALFYAQSMSGDKTLEVLFLD